MVKKVSDRQPKQQAKADTPAAEEANKQDSSATIDAKFQKKTPVWMPSPFAMVVTVLLILFYVDLGTFSLIGAMLACGLYGGAVAKYTDKNGFIGFGIGSAFGVVANIGMSYLKFYLSHPA